MCYLAGGNHRVSYDEMTVAQFRQIMELNLTGIFIGIKAVVHAPRRRRLHHQRDAARRHPAYACSKFGSALTAATAGCARRHPLLGEPRPRDTPHPRLQDGG